MDFLLLALVHFVFALLFVLPPTPLPRFGAGGSVREEAFLFKLFCSSVLGISSVFCNAISSSC